MNNFIKATITLVFFLALLAGCKDHDYCDDEMGAYIAGSRLIKDKLKAPATAEFPKYNNGNITKNIGNCRYVSAGYVDSKNSFGALIRTKYDVEVMYDLDSWVLINYSFKE